MWPDLLRRGGADPEEDQDSQLDRAGDNGDPDLSLRVDEQQLLATFKHLYWTRLTTMGDYETGVARKWPLGPDIVEECEAVAVLHQEDPDTWSPLFEPADYNERHGSHLIEDHRLSQEQPQP